MLRLLLLLTHPPCAHILQRKKVGGVGMAASISAISHRAAQRGFGRSGLCSLNSSLCLRLRGETRALMKRAETIKERRVQSRRTNYFSSILIWPASRDEMGGKTKCGTSKSFCKMHLFNSELILFCPLLHFSLFSSSSPPQWRGIQLSLFFSF